MHIIQSDDYDERVLSDSMRPKIDAIAGDVVTCEEVPENFSGSKRHFSKWATVSGAMPHLHRAVTFSQPHSRSVDFVLSTPSEICSGTANVINNVPEAEFPLGQHENRVHVVVPQDIIYNQMFVAFKKNKSMLSA